MIEQFVKAWDARKNEIRERFSREAPANYKDVVLAVISILGDGYGTPDPERIHEIDDGDYQGTLVYVIAERGYQPSSYWYFRVSYGSCSGCDTLEAIRGYSSDVPSESEVNEYMTLALHVLQGPKSMDGDVA